MENRNLHSNQIKDMQISQGMFAIKGYLDEKRVLDQQVLLQGLRRFIKFQDKSILNVHPPLDKTMNRLLKRMFDILISTFISVAFLTWLIPIIVILIKLDSGGKVFLLKKCNKRSGGMFTSIKFRTLTENDEADVTRIEQVLKKYKLDELPQFLNVLLGHMSLIGPQPYTIGHNLKFAELIEHYDCRNKVKPGIAGLAQVMDYAGQIKNLQVMKESVKLDLFYVRHWSIKLDVKIILYTIFRKLRFS